jgi:Na+-transporting NADH:ubiquinone oxidoreductase subunit C
MANQKETVSKTLLTAVLLCLVCSVIVSGAAVALKPLQVANKLEDKRKNILSVAGVEGENKSINELFSQITPRIVNMEAGRYATDAEIADANIDTQTYDQRKAAKTPKLSVVLTGDQDIASIKRQAKFAEVYLVEKNGAIDSIILPVHGYGLWSTMYGFLALEGDGQTIKGLAFYEHGETPGLGGEIDNPKWKASWVGKKLYDTDGSIAIGLVKGSVDLANPKANTQIDGLSGATLTGRGVTNLVQFWIGENGFAAFLNSLKAKEA